MTISYFTVTNMRPLILKSQMSFEKHLKQMFILTIFAFKTNVEWTHRTYVFGQMTNNFGTNFTV